MSSSMDITPAQQTADAVAPDRKRWFALAVVLVAAFMDLLDVTIVNVAVPSIQHDLNAGYSAVEWVIAGYALAFAAILITGGRLGDIYGRKRLFLIGMIGFTIASALCGTSATPGMLIGARVFQGGMAALMVPQVLAIIHVTFPPEERGKVFGMFGGIVGSAAVMGPILGGLLVQWNLFGWHWRPVFLVNVPVGVIGVFAAWRYIRESRSSDAPRLDLGGMALATIGVLLLAYPLTEGRDLGWPWWAFAMMGGAAVVLAVFVRYERRVMARGGSPLVVLTLFRSRGFAGGFGVNLLFFLTVGTFFLMWSLYMQIGLGWTPLHAGLTGIPFSIGVSAAAGMSIQFLTPKFGRKVLIAGGLTMAAGTLVYVWVTSRYGIEVHSWQMILPLVVMGVGMGFVVAPVIDFALTEVPHDAAGSASGVIGMAQQLGSAVGIALVGVVFLSAMSSQAGKGVDAVSSQTRQQLAAVGLPSRAQDDILANLRACVKDRSGQKDPSAVPASCDTAPPPGVSAQQGEKIGAVLADAGKRASGTIFSDTFRLGLFYVGGLLLLVSVLMLTLPRFSRPQEF